jgi:hypothetical protein
VPSLPWLCVAAMESATEVAAGVAGERPLAEVAFALPGGSDHADLDST